MCGSNLALILQASDTVILSKNGAYLRFSQSGNINSSAFEVLLNDRIVFHHWFQRPDEAVAYDVSVTVSISAGMFTNNATAVITVEVINVRPSVLLVSEDIPQMSNLTVNFSTLSGSLEVTGVSSTELYVSDGTNVVTRFTTVQISFMNDRPVVDLNGQGAGSDFQTSFDEGGVPVSVSSALNISDDGFAT